MKIEGKFRGMAKDKKKQTNAYLDDLEWKRARRTNISLSNFVAKRVILSEKKLIWY
jgi:hypothetical protein